LHGMKIGFLNKLKVLLLKVVIYKMMA